MLLIAYNSYTKCLRWNLSNFLWINYILMESNPWPVFKRLCYVVGMCNCLARSHSMFFTLNRGIAYWDLRKATRCLGIKYFLNFPVFDQLCSSSTQTPLSLTDILLWASVTSSDFTGVTMLLLLYFLCFSIVCRQTGWCIVQSSNLNNWKDS